MASDLHDLLGLRARYAMDLAYDEVLEHRHDHIDVEHILLGLLGVPGSSACELLRRLDLDPLDLDLRCRRLMPVPSLTGGALAEPLFFSLDADRCLEAAEHEAKRDGWTPVGTEHLLLGLLQVRGRQPAALLRYLGVTRVTLLSQLRRLRSGEDACAWRRPRAWWQGRLNVLDDAAESEDAFPAQMPPKARLLERFDQIEALLKGLQQELQRLRGVLEDETQEDGDADAQHEEESA